MLAPRFPAWLHQCRRETIAADLIAGLVVAILVIPQSLAYALLAGLPPHCGLYASIFPVMAYALLGSSMTLSLGPVAITAIMTLSVLSPLATAGSPEYVSLAASLSLLSGLLILGSGMLRLGFLSQLLSRPVMSGFITGSAILIILSQLKFLLGIRVQGSNTWQILTSLVEHLPETQPTTMLISACSLLALFLSRRWLGHTLIRAGIPLFWAELPGKLMPLVVLAGATAVVVHFDLHRAQQVEIVGSVHGSLDAFSFFLPESETLRALLIPALLMALIGMVQNIALAQAMAVKRRERVDANRELIGLGTANVVAAFYGGMPVGGGLSRTAINVSAGAQTPLSSVVAAAAMLALLTIGTRWLSPLPLAVLAANIVVAAVSMIDLSALHQAWRYDRADAAALLGTAAGVLTLGLTGGIALGIGLSLMALLYRTSTPHIAVIGRLPGTEHFRNVERYATETLPGVLFLRIDESLFFGNLDAIQARLSSELDKAPQTVDVVLAMNGVNRIDTTAMEALNDLNADLRTRGIRLHLAEVKGPVHDRLARSPLLDALSGNVHLSVNQAFEAINRRPDVENPLTRQTR